MRILEPHVSLNVSDIAKAVHECYRDFKVLAFEIAKRSGVTLP